MTAIYNCDIIKIPMKPELLARVIKIIAKTGEKAILVDTISQEPFVIMGLDSYERIAVCSQIKLEKDPNSVEDLTQNSAGGIMARGEESSILPQRDICSEPKRFVSATGIDPDVALLKESRNMSAGEWGGDETAADERYYMEPAE